MLKKQSQVLISILFLIDLSIVWICWTTAYYIRFYWLNFNYQIFGVDIPYVIEVPEFERYLRASAVVVIFAAICFIYSKMYNPKRISRYRAEFRSIIKANLFLYIILLAVTFFYRSFTYSRVQSAYFLLLSVVVIVLFRFSVRAILVYLRKTGRNLRRVLIIGNGQTSRNLIKKFGEIRSLGFLIVGYVFREDTGDLLSVPFLGVYNELPQLIEAQEIDQVYIALDSNQQSDLEEINQKLAEQMVDLNIVPDVYHTLNINPELLDLDGVPVIALRQSTVEGWNRILKRLFDLLGAFLLTILLFPLWFILPILIKLTSPGPIFYFQERMGLDGRSFQMIKFRTMRVDAEVKTGAVWARKDDERTTGLGAFLRKTSLDEFPQLFNVLQGAMSLVGPRPERPVFIKDFKKQIPYYMLRHKMKAGMTGWAQVNGWRGNTSLEKRIECDIYYLTHWTLWFDIKIILLTLISGFVNPNAY
jgi:Undecaprenyl-phosphate glucose phosphotransferase